MPSDWSNSGCSFVDGIFVCTGSDYVYKINIPAMVSGYAIYKAKVTGSVTESTPIYTSEADSQIQNSAIVTFYTNNDLYGYDSSDWTDTGMDYVVDDWYTLKIYAESVASTYDIYNITNQSQKVINGWTLRGSNNDPFERIQLLGNANLSVSDMWWSEHDFEVSDTYTVQVGAQESQNYVPLLTGLNCSNGTAWKTSFSWNENVEQCQVSCIDTDSGEPLYVNFTGLKGISPYDGEVSDDWFDSQNSTADISLYTIDISSLVYNVNESGTYNVTATCFDGSVTNTTTISWDVDYGYLLVYSDYPNTDISVQNGTAWPEQAHGYITCNNGECFNVTAYLDPIKKNER